jgi:hypothetical protein
MAMAMANSTIRNMYAYVVLENGELYPVVYYSYEAARDAVLTKYAEELDEERSDCEGTPYGMASKVDVDENKETGTTKLYIEKEIYITVQRYAVRVSP